MTARSSPTAPAAICPKFNVAGLPNGTYWLCVVNFAGVNAGGFTISAKMTFVNVPDFPTPPPDPTPFRTSPPKKVVPSSAPSKTPLATPVLTPEVVKTPGADEGSQERELIAVSGSRQAPPSGGGQSGLQAGLFALTGVIVAAGLGLVILRIRRDTAL